MKNHRYALKICYEGTNYAGWQIQPNALTIQQVLNEKLSILLKQQVYVVGSGRTDSGVHAYAQVAHFDCLEKIETTDLLYHLNATLDPQIKVLQVVEVDQDFHARFSAIGKKYVYYLDVGVCPSPFHRHFSWHINYALDVELLKQALQLFEGTHDFSSFAHKASQGSASVNPVRTIHSIELTYDFPLIAITFSGSGFLHKMIRNIIGACIACVNQKISLDELKSLFALKNRRKAPKTAPAKGLCLAKVQYETEVFFDENPLCLKPSMVYSIV